MWTEKHESDREGQKIKFHTLKMDMNISFFQLSGWMMR